ncbi:hypothetical protein EsH8_VI_001016 [Colletotrichum jinshuiense]
MRPAPSKKGKTPAADDGDSSDENSRRRGESPPQLEESEDEEVVDGFAGVHFEEAGDLFAELRSEEVKPDIAKKESESPGESRQYQTRSRGRLSRIVDRVFRPQPSSIKDEVVVKKEQQERLLSDHPGILGQDRSANPSESEEYSAPVERAQAGDVYRPSQQHASSLSSPPGHAQSPSTDLPPSPQSALTKRVRMKKRVAYRENRQNRLDEETAEAAIIAAVSDASAPSGKGLRDHYEPSASKGHVGLETALASRPVDQTGIQAANRASSSLPDQVVKPPPGPVSPSYSSRTPRDTSGPANERGTGSNPSGTDDEASHESEDPAKKVQMIMVDKVMSSFMSWLDTKLKAKNEDKRPARRRLVSVTRPRSPVKYDEAVLSVTRSSPPKRQNPEVPLKRLRSYVPEMLHSPSPPKAMAPAAPISLSAPPSAPLSAPPAPVKVGASSAAPPPPPAAFGGARKRTGLGQTPRRKASEKRGRSDDGKREQEEDDDDDDDDNGNRPPRAKLPKVQEDGADGAKLACPFFKHNPRKYKNQRPCCGPGWDHVHRIKEHIYRKHSLPKFSCPRCSQPFETQSDLQAHARSPDPCEVREPEVLDGITQDQEKRLRSRKKTSAKELTEAEKWAQVYGILFPDVKEREIPSPYYNTEDASTNLGGYEDYLRRELPPLVRRRLEKEVERELSFVEEGMKQKVIDIARNLQLALFRGYQELENQERGADHDSPGVGASGSETGGSSFTAAAATDTSPSTVSTAGTTPELPDPLEIFGDPVIPDFDFAFLSDVPYPGLQQQAKQSGPGSGFPGGLEMQQPDTIRPGMELLDGEQFGLPYFSLDGYQDGSGRIRDPESLSYLP